MYIRCKLLIKKISTFTRVQLLQEQTCACMSPKKDLCLVVIFLQWVVDQMELKQISRQSSCHCRSGTWECILNRLSLLIPACRVTFSLHLLETNAHSIWFYQGHPAAHVRNEKICIQDLADNQLFPEALSSQLFIALCVFFCCRFSFFFCRDPTSGLTNRPARSTPASVILNAQHLRFIWNTLRTPG